MSVTAVFWAFMNLLLPESNVFPMYCLARASKSDDTISSFRLSGTGKTTVSADPERLLIGDGEHGWRLNGSLNVVAVLYAERILKNRRCVIQSGLRCRIQYG